MKIKNNQVTGADVKESSLGKVPQAANADHATSADSATNATKATNATTLAGLHANDFGRVAGAMRCTAAGPCRRPDRGRGSATPERSER